MANKRFLRHALLLKDPRAFHARPVQKPLGDTVPLNTLLHSFMDHFRIGRPRHVPTTNPFAARRT